MFRALGDPTRLQIVRNLQCCPDTVCGPTAGEMCCEITGATKVSSTFSHHLNTLREAALIQTEKQGKCVCCALDRQSVRELAEFLLAIVEGETNECCAK